MSLEWTTVAGRKGRQHNCASHGGAGAGDRAAKIEAAQSALSAANREFRLWSTATQHAHVAAVLSKVRLRLKELEDCGFAQAFAQFAAEHTRPLFVRAAAAEAASAAAAAAAAAPAPVAAAVLSAALAADAEAGAEAAAARLAADGLDVVCYGLGSALLTNATAQLQLCALLALSGVGSRGAAFTDALRTPALAALVADPHAAGAAAGASASASASARKRHKQKKAATAAAVAAAVGDAKAAPADAAPATAAAGEAKNAATAAAAVARARALATRVFVYDPLLSALEIAALQALGLEVLTANEEGKRRIDLTPPPAAPPKPTAGAADQKVAGGAAAGAGASGSARCTLFYMPHCGRGLYNNVVWANWGGGARLLHRIAVFGNSFALYRNRSPNAAPAAGPAAAGAAADAASACLHAISPYTAETPLPSTLLSGAAVSDALSAQLSTAFNDSALHTFGAFPADAKAAPARPPEYTIAAGDGAFDPEIIPSALTTTAAIAGSSASGTFASA